jgi:hypothetical protein
MISDGRIGRLRNVDKEQENEISYVDCVGKPFAASTGYSHAEGDFDGCEKSQLRTSVDQKTQSVETRAHSNMS